MRTWFYENVRRFLHRWKESGICDGWRWGQCPTPPSCTHLCTNWGSLVIWIAFGKCTIFFPVNFMQVSMFFFSNFVFYFFVLTISFVFGAVLNFVDVALSSSLIVVPNCWWATQLHWGSSFLWACYNCIGWALYFKEAASIECNLFFDDADSSK